MMPASVGVLRYGVFKLWRPLALGRAELPGRTHTLPYVVDDEYKLFYPLAKEVLSETAPLNQSPADQSAPACGGSSSADGALHFNVDGA